MQDLSYLTTNGVLNFDPNAYLNSPVVGTPNSYGQIGLLPQGTKLQNQPAKDGFVSKNKETIKKVAAGVILAGLAAFGIYKCKNGATKLAEAFSKTKGNVTASATNTINQGKDFLSKCVDKVKDFFKK